MVRSMSELFGTFGLRTQTTSSIAYESFVAFLSKYSTPSASHAALQLCYGPVQKQMTVIDSI